MIASRKFLFFNFFVIYFIYAASADILFSTKSVISYIVGIGFFIYSVYIVTLYSRKNKITVIIVVYIAFLFFLITFSSNFIYSAKLFIKATTPMLFFIVALTFIKNGEDFMRINKSIIILMILFLINILISNIFGLGQIQYEEEVTIDVGNIYTIGLNSMAYFLVSLPVLLNMYHFRNKNYKLLLVVFSIITLIIMLILLKRAALIGLVVGYFIWFVTSRLKNKIMISRILIIVAIALTISYPIYKGLLIEKFKAREDRFKIDTYETEGRYLENIIVLKEIFSFNDMVYSLFGREMFNSPGNYGEGAWGTRQLHSDYANILNGSGIIGMLFYLYVNYAIFKLYQKERRKLRRINCYNRDEKLLNSFFLAFFIMYFFIGLSGGLDGTLYTGIRFIYLGAIISLFRNTYIRESKRSSYVFVSSPDVTSAEGSRTPVLLIK